MRVEQKQGYIERPKPRLHPMVKVTNIAIILGLVIAACDEAVPLTSTDSNTSNNLPTSSETTEAIGVTPASTAGPASTIEATQTPEETISEEVVPSATSTEEVELCEEPFELANTGFIFTRDENCNNWVAESPGAVKRAAELDMGQGVPGAAILTDKYWVREIDGHFVKKDREAQGMMGEAYLRGMAIVSLRQKGKYNNTTEDYRQEYERIKKEFNDTGRVNGIYFNNPDGDTFELSGQPLVISMEQFSFNNSGGWEARGSGSSMGFTINATSNENSVIMKIMTAPDGLNAMFGTSVMEGRDVGRAVNDEELRQLYSQKLFAVNLIRTFELVAGMDWDTEVFSEDWHLRPEALFLAEVVDPALPIHLDAFKNEYLPEIRKAVRNKDFDEISKIVGSNPQYDYSLRPVLLGYMEESLFEVEAFDPSLLR